MNAEQIHKYIKLEPSKNGNTEVRIAGQLAMCITTPMSFQTGNGGDVSESFYWKINPAFAVATYGAKDFGDIPYCTQQFESVELAVADGVLKLLDLGVMATAVDLPEDTFAATMNEAAEKLNDTDNALLIEASNGVFDYSKLKKLQKIGITLSEEAVQDTFDAFTNGTITPRQLYMAKLHTESGAMDFVQENGLTIFSTIQLNEVVFDEEEIDKEQELSSTVTESTSFAKFRAEKRRVDEALKLIATHTSKDGKKVAKHYRDAEWDEHRVKHFIDGVHQKNADYHTDDKSDASGTAKKWVSEAKESEYSANLSLAGDKSVDDKTKPIKIKNAAGKVVSSHSTVSAAFQTYKNMPNNAGHKIVGYKTVGESIEEVDITEIAESSSKDEDAAYEKWVKQVGDKHGTDKIKFKGRIEKGLHTTSAEIPGKDRSYGVFYHDDGTSHVFEEEQEYEFPDETLVEDTPVTIPAKFKSKIVESLFSKAV